MEATRLLTLSAVDAGKKPSVASAIAKYHLTEFSRQVLNDAMDIHGGKGIMMGPKNYLGRGYQGIPIAITVEGANILTRNLIIFGQGAMFAHPCIRNIFYALQNPDAQVGMKALDDVLLSHMAYHAHNQVRAIWYGLTGGRLIDAPTGELTRFYQSVTRLSAAYAWIADVALVVLGGGLKRREYLSAKLGDVMSYLYMAMATLKAYHDHQEQPEELAYAKWALEFTLHSAEEALFDILQEFPISWLGKTMQYLVFPWGRSYAKPSFQTAQAVAEQMQMETTYRKNLQSQCAGFNPTDEGVGQLEFAFSKLLESVPANKKLKAFVKRHSDYQSLDWLDQAKKALEHNEMTQAEYDLLVVTFHAQVAALQVDAFPKTSFKK
jgi:acyl-CoA dehydrogenase